MEQVGDRGKRSPEEPPNEDVGFFKWGRFVTPPKTSIGSKAYGRLDVGASGLRQVSSVA